MKPLKTVQSKKKAGFSLLEILVVLTIIGILLAVAIPSFTASRVFELDGASKQAVSFFEEARTEAMSYGEPVRILVHRDSGHRETGFLQRAIAIRRTDEKADDGSTEWKEMMNPLILPGGIYFDLSQPGTSSRTMSYRGMDGETQEWIYYEILAHGAPTGEERNLVLGPGILDKSATTPSFPTPEAVAGFRITDAGRIVQFRGLEEIEKWSQ